MALVREGGKGGEIPYNKYANTYNEDNEGFCRVQIQQIGFESR